ncbi:hypothetical protein DMH01_14830 [Amycolatopsis sp. WAC 04182]|nr:hypothetical protein DMH01_14830 [Amycolatopsis sp. WAC 04182]
MIAGLITAGAMTSGFNDDASAASEHESPASIASNLTYLPNYGDRAYFPTWFFGETRLCVYNPGLGESVAKIQSQSPAAPPEHLYPQPGATECISRWWWGVPVSVYNDGHSPLYTWTY